MRTAPIIIAFFSAVLLMACNREKSADTQPVTTQWKCPHCNEWHSDLPFVYGPLYPDPYLAIPEEEREKRTQWDKDFCIIDDKQFFVRGHLEIPVRDSKETFAWDVWVSLSKQNFDRTINLMETAGREKEPPYIGWLCTNLSIYPDTTNLKTLVHTQPVGRVPIIELEVTEHPLSVEQKKGITLDRVKEIAALILHDDYKPKKRPEK